MVEAGVPFPKTHDLELILNLVTAVEPLWAVFAVEMRSLTEWGVLPRYPGKDADASKARIAVGTCRRFREAARQSLGLKP